jgi:hypothetical protein
MAVAKLDEMAESLQEPDTRPLDAAFETPSFSRRSSIDSTPSLPLKIVGRPNTPIANSDYNSEEARNRGYECRHKRTSVQVLSCYDAQC